MLNAWHRFYLVPLCATFHQICNIYQCKIRADIILIFLKVYYEKVNVVTLIIIFFLDNA
jgi:hypothetical protein